MKVPYNDLSRIHDTDEICAALRRVVESGNFIGAESFAREFCRYTEAKYCVPCANGTDALTIAIMALDLPPKSKVAVPAISYAATAMAVVNAGHEIEFVDVDRFGLMDLEKLKKVDVALAIPVHLYGQCVDVKEIGIPYIEDCAQAHCAHYMGRHVGNFGKFGCFSFYPGKNLGAMGDAGCVITNDEELYEKAKSVCSLGASTGDRYLHNIRGVNSRMDAFQGEILKLKLDKLDYWATLRCDIGLTYLENIEFSPGRGICGYDAFHVYYLLSSDRDGDIKKLRDKGIQCNIHYPHALNTLECFKVWSKRCPVAERFCSRCYSIPLFPKMTDEEVWHVINCVNEINIPIVNL